MIYKINKFGLKYFINRKKEAIKFFFIAPLFLLFFGIAFYFGYEHKFLQIFGLSSVFLLALFYLLATLYVLNIDNKLVNQIIIKDKVIILSTFNVFFLKSKKQVIDRQKLRFYKKKKMLDEKSKFEVIIWEIKNDNSNLEIVREFFDPELRQYIDPSSIID